MTFSISCYWSDATVREITLMIAATLASRSFTSNEAASVVGAINRSEVATIKGDHLARMPHTP
ncbi:hypothetical protein ACVWZR_007634 [Bradyrhizobium sp. i1.3.1]